MVLDETLQYLVSCQRNFFEVLRLVKTRGGTWVILPASDWSAQVTWLLYRPVIGQVVLTPAVGQVNGPLRCPYHPNVHCTVVYNLTLYTIIEHNIYISPHLLQSFTNGLDTINSSSIQQYYLKVNTFWYFEEKAHGWVVVMLKCQYVYGCSVLQRNEQLVISARCE